VVIISILYIEGNSLKIYKNHKGTPT